MSCSIHFNQATVGEFYNQWILPVQENHDVFDGRIELSHACVNAQDIVFFACCEKKVVGMLAIEQDSHGVWHNLFVATDSQWQGRGIAGQLLKMQFSFVAQHGGVLVNSRYSALGREKMKKYNEAFASQYGVEFWEHDEPRQDSSTMRLYEYVGTQ